MVRKNLLKSCIVVLIAANSTHAAEDRLSRDVKELLIKTIDTSFQAATTCYSIQYLLFSAFEARGRGAAIDAVIAAAAPKGELRPELRLAIETAFEVDEVTDPRVDRLYADCLKKARAQLAEPLR